MAAADALDKKQDNEAQGAPTQPGPFETWGPRCSQPLSAMAGYDVSRISRIPHKQVKPGHAATVSAVRQTGCRDARWTSQPQIAVV